IFDFRAGCKRSLGNGFMGGNSEYLWVARPEVLRRACLACKRLTPFGVPQGVPPLNQPVTEHTRNFLPASPRNQTRQRVNALSPPVARKRDPKSRWCRRSGSTLN